MIDFGQLLSQKIDAIAQNWVASVQQDQQIETAQELTYREIQNSLPKVLQAMATVLSQSEHDDLQLLIDVSLEHGVLRAEQGFDPAEIAREYRLLRYVIFSMLEEDLLQGTPIEIIRATRLIDMVIDEAIARCFKSYTEGRLQELEQLLGQIRLTNQELTRLVRTSQSNLSHLAHELKTPLTSIIGYSDLFLRQQRQTTNLKAATPNLESIERVLQGGRQLLHLINDALEISRYEAGQMRVQVACVPIGAIVNDVIAMIKPIADAKHLTLDIDLSDAPDHIQTDPLRLQQILTNLLSNAIRYTEQGSIKLVCRTVSDHYWAIAITDHGIGIDPEDRSRIFEPYIRGRLGEALHAADSTGLGLAIVSRLVKLLKGEIQVESAVGKGSTFTVQLPLNLEL